MTVLHRIYIMWESFENVGLYTSEKSVTSSMRNKKQTCVKYNIAELLVFI